MFFSHLSWIAQFYSHVVNSEVAHYCFLQMNIVLHSARSAWNMRIISVFTAQLSLSLNLIVNTSCECKHDLSC